MLSEVPVVAARPGQSAPLKSLGLSWESFPFIAIHLLCLAAIQTGVRWEWVVLAVGSYYVRMIGVTAGYHRYFSHRSFKTSRVFQFLLAFWAMTSAQKGCSGGPPITAITISIQTGKKISILPCSGDSGIRTSAGSSRMIM